MGRHNSKREKGFCCPHCDAWLQCSFKANTFPFVQETLLWQRTVNILKISLYEYKHDSPIDVTRKSVIRSQQDSRAEIESLALSPATQTQQS